MCREAIGRADPVEADRTTIRSLPNHSSRANFNYCRIQASGHLASTEHSPLLACWSGGPSPKRGTARGARSVESLKTQVHHIWSLRRARLGFGHMRLDCTLQQPARGYFGGHEAGGRHERRGGQARPRADSSGSFPPPISPQEVAQPHLPAFERASRSDVQRLPARPRRWPVVTMVCSALRWLQCDVRHFGRCACACLHACLHACFPCCTLRPISLPLGP